MEALRIENLSFCYPNREEAALQNLSFTVNKGEFVTLIGASGSGKTTLLRHLKPPLAPAGKTSGEIFLNGMPVEKLSRREICQKIGFVFQDPDEQIVTDKVWHELAFGLENLGLGSEEIRLRVAETAAFFGLEELFRRETASLSGGQKQLLNLACVMAAQPEILLLDEPTGQLDPGRAEEFLQMLRRVNLELGTTIIVSEHRAGELISMSGKLLALDSGRMAACGAPRELASALRENGGPLLYTLPVPARVWAAVESDSPCPLSVGEGRAWLRDFAEKNDLLPLDPEEIPAENETALEIKDLWFRYDKNAPDVLRGLSVTVRRGEIFALMGGNGAGKSTALGVMAGLFRAYRGRVTKNGSTALLPQDPKMLFTRPTLASELKDGAKSPDALEETVSFCGLKNLLQCHPYDLSGGEKQLAALCKLLLRDPDILLLDEPTKGLDAAFKRSLSGLLRALSARGKTVVLVSHDLEFCAMCATKCAMLFDGEICGQGTPRAVFSGKSFYTTAAGRMSRGILDGAALAEDIIKACGGSGVLPGETPGGKTPADSPSLPGKPPVKKAPAPTVSGKKTRPPRKKPGARAVISALIILALVPLTVFLGLQYFGERRYYFVSLTVALETLLIFFLIFEGRKPRARELVVIATLCALAAGGRAAFYMLMQFKPTLALIIISGACLGGEAGFVVGAMTAFVSNFFFGQGPWTPWQMLAMGLVGFFAGALFCGAGLKKTRLSLCVYGAFASLVIYGGIMNPASVMLSQASPGPGAFLAAFALGLPMDLIQCAATLVFLLLLAKPIIEKLERLKTKFGLELG